MTAPTARDLREALMVAVWAFAATFFSGLILHGLDVLHFSNGRLALEAGIAAGLAALGWEVLPRSVKPAP